MPGRACGPDPGPARGHGTLKTTGVPSQAAKRADVAAGRSSVDEDSQRWLTRLRAVGPERVAALAELHALLLRAARFEVGRRHAVVPAPARRRPGRPRPAERRRRAVWRSWASSTTSAARADSPPGPTSSRCYEAAAQGAQARLAGTRDPAGADEAWPASPTSAAGSRRASAETRELLAALRAGDQSRADAPTSARCCVALAVNDVPIDVLADRLNTTRGALYKTIHDARRKLRAALAARGLSIDEPWVRSANEPGLAPATPIAARAPARAGRPRADLRAVLRRARPLRRARAGQR